jgi:hypothetical protein
VNIAGGPPTGGDDSPRPGEPAGRGVVGRFPASFRRRDLPNSRPLPEWVRRLAWVLDDAFLVPGLKGRRAGIDGLISFVPVIGDVAGIVVSMVVVLAGVAAGVSVPTAVRMMLNVGLEAAVGVVPVLGAVFDLAFKANNRNVALIEADLADRSATRRSSTRVLLLAVALLVAALVMVVVAAVAAVAALLWLFTRWS